MAKQRPAAKAAKKAPAKKAASEKAVKKSQPKKAVKAPAKVVKKAAPSKAMPAKAKASSPQRDEGSAKSGKSSKGSKLGKADLNYFRDLLLEKRREILGDVGSMESEAFKAGSNLSNMPIHMADVGTDNFEQEFTLGLIESERQILREIQEALLRVENGTYGVCQGTGNPIPRVRLEAVPWAKYTREYAEALEQGRVRRDNGYRAAAEDEDED